MTDIPFTIIRSRNADDARLVELTVSTPDFQEAIVTVSKDVAESPLLQQVVQAALRSRQRTIDQLKPVDE